MAMIGTSRPILLVVAQKSPFKSGAGTLARAYARPSGQAFLRQRHVRRAAGESFKSLGKVDILHVPYRARGQTINDLIGGQIDAIFSTSAASATRSS